MKSNVFVTGDTHGECSPKFSPTFMFNNTKAKYTDLTKNDYMIITGDAGPCWNNSDNDKFFQDWLSKKPWTTLFCDGNHEGFHILNNYPVTEWHGGKVHMITPSIIHLMRGQIYEINNETYFVMGGATSIDRHRRIPGVSWWPEELPSMEEYKEAENNLKKHNYKVDYVISHCCSSRTQYKIDRSFSRDSLTDWFNDLEAQLEYKHWYFGHYHFDETLDDKHTCLYDTVIRIGDTIKTID